MSPHELMILNACYKCSSPSVNILPHIWNAPAAVATRDNFVCAGLIEPITFRATAIGEQLLEMACEVGTKQTARAALIEEAYRAGHRDGTARDRFSQEDADWNASTIRNFLDNWG